MTLDQAPEDILREEQERNPPVATHNHPTSIKEHGLADGCPRCDEHAEDPFLGLDDGNMEQLIDRLADRTDSRSANEGLAMARLARAMVRARNLYRNGWRPQ